MFSSVLRLVLRWWWWLSYAIVMVVPSLGLFLLYKDGKRLTRKCVVVVYVSDWIVSDGDGAMYDIYD
jgi:hypothetical protein